MFCIYVTGLDTAACRRYIEYYDQNRAVLSTPPRPPCSDDESCGYAPSRTTKPATLLIKHQEGARGLS